HKRDLLQIDLDPKITARHHHGFGCRQDAVDIVNSLMLFNLRNDRNISFTIFDDLLASEDIAGTPDEAQSNRIDALFQTNENVLAVFFRQRIQMNVRSGQVDAFVRAQLAANDDPAVNIRWHDFLNAQFDVAVGEQDGIAGLHFVGQALQRNRYVFTVARYVIGCQIEFLSRLALDNSILNCADQV